MRSSRLILGWPTELEEMRPDPDFFLELEAFFFALGTYVLAGFCFRDGEAFWG
tara:strand:+ start:428 stop:586 length:159 start_codon:yes stop_codon:yes gene_type:complete